MTRAFSVQFRDLTYWTSAPEKRIPTVGSTLKKMLLGAGPKHRVDILKGLTGRLQPCTMTLLMGPPGCGKTTLLKALSGYITSSSRAQLDGDIMYNGDSTSTKKFLVQKLASYTDENDIHAATLTVQETLEFAWLMTSGGHHSYGVAKDAASAALFDIHDEKRMKLHNVIAMLGLTDVAHTVVGDEALKGISGGQKRRVTQGELLLPPRPVKFMDAISNGLDASTTYDIIRSHRFIVERLGLTQLTSLLQVSIRTYVYTNIRPTTKALEYFEGLGYRCPENTDAPDFLQELPTPDGRRFVFKQGAPRGAEALAYAWKQSDLFKAMLGEMDQEVAESSGEWPEVFTEFYPRSFWFAFVHCLERQWKLTIRDSAFIKGRIMQYAVVGAIAGSLFSNLDIEDGNTTNGLIFFCSLFNSLASMSMLPVIYSQKAVFFKHSKNLFFPTGAFVLAQTIVLYPFQMLETLIFCSIVYWSAGFSNADGGSRFFTFMLIMFVFGLFIIPETNIPDGWIWFYWINPSAYVLKALSINEFSSSDYDFVQTGTSERFGDVQLKARGTPTDMVWVWYCILVMLAMYAFFLLLSTYAYAYMQSEPAQSPPVFVVETEGEADGEAEGGTEVEAAAVEIPFEPVTLSFRDVWYSVTPKGSKGEELDLLKGVSGYFEPGTVTALMGSSGAGKTTLLDVLAGRKNTGTVRGGIYVNGKKRDRDFRHLMGYVEQFDSLSPNDTAREAVEFSAALRLPAGTPADVRAAWVTSVLTLLELLPLEHTLVGSQLAGGMSFEQKKRVSIALELAANPAVLFLDEPTSGLDSRAAQPSSAIFEAFDRLLLLQRGGQTVFFGELGTLSCNLVQYFEAVPGVAPKALQQNPSVYALETIGAGTGGAGVTVDFHRHYLQSALCQANSTQVGALSGEEGEEEEDVDVESGRAQSSVGSVVVPSVLPWMTAIKHHSVHAQYNAPHRVQFQLLMWRFLLSYWRSPSYNFARMVVSLVIALIFSSTFADQHYSTEVDVISRVALIYITVLFMGVVGMISVQPVIFAERPAFYREQYSQMYDVKIYTLAATLVELPYLVVSSLVFVVPFFFIVGFDRDGTTVKFF
ncbi:P-loop containing nucleoside triphosphate hydrolase protein, partial [Ochromonadaceae sp. CCMP2298]